MIIHGDAYKFFLKDLNNSIYKDDKELRESQVELGKRLKSLSENYSVEFEICQSGMKSRGISTEAIYKFVKPVYSAFSSIIEWQNRGYAYFLIK